jgi:RNA polymerase sigma factor (sigma-70 family)
MPAPAAAIPVPPPLRTLPELSDVEAVNGVIGGQREMFEVIVRRYNAQLYRVGMAYLRDHAQTEDAMQNAYLKAFLNLGRFRGSSAFSTWITRIMINECLMILRSRKAQRLEPFDEHQQHEHESFIAPQAEPMHREELKAVLEHALQFLPRLHRTVYVLREVQRLSTEETAQCLGISRDNVKVCLHRAREGLKAQLMKSAAGVELFAYPAQYCDPMTVNVMQIVLAAPSRQRA